MILLVHILLETRTDVAETNLSSVCQAFCQLNSKQPGRVAYVVRTLLGLA